MDEDSRLIEQIKNTQSSAASTRLVDKYKRRVFSLCLRIVKDWGTAEEVAQDIFIKILSKINTLKSSSEFQPWLMRIAYHAAIDVVRKKRVTMHSMDAAERLAGPDVTEEFASKERMERVEAAMMRFPAEDRAVLILYYMEDMSIKQIEKVTGLSQSNIKIKLFRTRQALREKLNPILKN